MKKEPHESAQVKEVNCEGFPSHLMEAINKDIEVKVYEVANKYQLTESEIEELQSEARCKVITSYPKFESERASFLTFAQNVVTNFLANWKVREYVRRKHIAPMTEEYELTAANIESDDEAKARNAEKVQAVMYAISQLNDLEKRVCELHMRYHSLEKVRKTLGLSCNRFYTVTWPLTCKNFKRFYNEAFV